MKIHNSIPVLWCREKVQSKFTRGESVDLVRNISWGKLELKIRAFVHILFAFEMGEFLFKKDKFSFSALVGSWRLLGFDSV